MPNDAQAKCPICNDNDLPPGRSMCDTCRARIGQVVWPRQPRSRP